MEFGDNLSFENSQEYVQQESAVCDLPFLSIWFLSVCTFGVGAIWVWTGWPRSEAAPLVLGHFLGHPEIPLLMSFAVDSGYLILPAVWSLRGPGFLCF